MLTKFKINYQTIKSILFKNQDSITTENESIKLRQAYVCKRTRQDQGPPYPRQHYRQQGTIVSWGKKSIRQN